VAYRVTTRGLDPSSPAGAQQLYSRLKHAAQVYLETHTLREAAARGIDLPLQLAVK
jgi:hypothetical protein